MPRLTRRSLLRVSLGSLIAAPLAKLLPALGTVPKTTAVFSFRGTVAYWKRNSYVTQISVWKRVLTPQERSILYAAGMGLSYERYPRSLKKGLSSHFDLAEVVSRQEEQERWEFEAREIDLRDPASYNLPFGLSVEL